MKRFEDHIKEICTSYVQRLRELGRLGTFNLDIKFSTDLAENAAPGKLTIGMSHYHYSKFNVHEDVKGHTLEETFGELQRRIQRDDTLLALPKPRPQITQPQNEEILF